MSESARPRNIRKALDLDGLQDYLAQRRRDNHHSPTPHATFVADMWQVFDELGNLLLDKHEAYGPRNISQAPGGPENGLRVRMWDKMARLNHILDNPDVDTRDESLEDTLKDLANYCAIFVMVRRNQWPEK